MSKFPMETLRRFTVGGVRLFGGGMKSKIYGLSVKAYLCQPFFLSMAMYSLEPAGVSYSKPTVLGILCFRGIAQVVLAVVQSVSVPMVYTWRNSWVNFTMQIYGLMASVIAYMGALRPMGDFCFIGSGLPIESADIFSVFDIDCRKQTLRKLNIRDGRADHLDNRANDKVIMALRHRFSPVRFASEGFARAFRDDASLYQRGGLCLS